MSTLKHMRYQLLPHTRVAVEFELFFIDIFAWILARANIVFSAIIDFIWETCDIWRLCHSQEESKLNCHIWHKTGSNQSVQFFTLMGIQFIYVIKTKLPVCCFCSGKTQYFKGRFANLHRPLSRSLHPGTQEVAVAVHATWEQSCTAYIRHSAPSPSQWFQWGPPSSSQSVSVPPPGKSSLVLTSLHWRHPHNHIILLGRMGGRQAERLSQRLCTSVSPEWEAHMCDVRTHRLHVEVWSWALKFTSLLQSVRVNLALKSSR